MATLEQLQQALIAADKAGATDDAKVLAQAIIGLKQSAPAAAAQPRPVGGPLDSMAGGKLHGAAMGMADPFMAVGQFLNNVPGVSSGLNAMRGGIRSGLESIGAKDTASLFSDVSPKEANQLFGQFNSDYEANRSAAGRDGIDFARIAGSIANPVNRIVPMGSAASTAGVAARAGAQGAISGAMTPVTDGGNYWGQKAGQVVLGAGGGAAGGAIADKLMQGVGNIFAGMRARPGFPELLGGGGASVPAEAQAQAMLAKAAADQGIDLGAIPKTILDDVRGNVVSALKQGKTPDAKTMARMAEGQAVLGTDAGLMTGQATRDPQLFARELDLRGIQGAGKPIADRLSLQNQRLIEAVGKKGAAGAPDAYDTGSSALSSLTALDKKLSADVTAAYGKFRMNGGATVDVPLQPLAQKLGDVVETFGKENIPSAVMSKLESYGLGGMKQTKVFDLLEADKLIKIINANHDPMKGPQAAAMGSLRKGLSEAIDLADTQSQGASGPAADLLREALSKAKARFSLHEAVPALESAVKDPVAQEAFVRQFITSKSASIDSVGGLVKLLSPEAQDAVKRNVLSGILESAAPGASRGSDAAKFSQAGYRKALDAIGDRKLAMLFGDDGLAQLRQVGRVSEWIQSEPAASAVNRANTAAGVMNLVQGLAGKGGPISQKLMSLPGANMLRGTLSTAVDESAVRGSLLGMQAPKAAQLAPEEIDALRRYMPVIGGLLGGATASAIR